MTDIRPFLVNGQWRTGDGTFEVRNPYDDSLVAELGVPTEADVEEAVALRGRDVRGVAEAVGGRPRRRPSTTSPAGSTRRRRRTPV